MTDKTTSNSDNYDAETQLEDVADNAGARAAAIAMNPAISLEEARNAAEGKAPNAAASGISPSETENHIPGTSDPEGSDLPTANAPAPRQVRDEQKNGEKQDGN